MKRLLKLTAWPVGIALLIGLYFLDNIRGYYRFKEICEKEAGLRVYEPIQKNKGWQTLIPNSDSKAAYLLSYYNGISYVRFEEKNGILHDLRRTGEKKNRWDSGFRPEPSASNDQPLYEYHDDLKTVTEEVRINRYASTVTNLQSGKLAVIYQDFTYRLFNQDWGLGRGTSCSSFNRNDSGKSPNESKEIAIQTAFSK